MQQLTFLFIIIIYCYLLTTGLVSTQRVNQKVNKPAAASNSNLKALARWCCINDKELVKCEQWKFALNIGASNQSNLLLDCVLATDKFDCFRHIFEDKADLMTADAGDIYTAGKYYNLVPISSEIYSSIATGISEHNDFYAVAVVKRGTGMTIDRLRGANSCHGGVGTSAGWNVPISTLIEMKLLDIVDCNNHVKAATKFFSKMCAPDALNTQFNPTGDNPTSVCELCIGKIGSTFCTNQDPYAGYIGAMYCLNDGGGDVAFVKHTAIFELASTNRSINLNNYELLCPKRTSSNPQATASVNDYAQCNWGKIPGRAVLTSSRKALLQRNEYKEFLKLSAKLFTGRPPSSIAAFNIYERPVLPTTTTPLPSWFFNWNPQVPSQFQSYDPYSPLEYNSELLVPAEVKAFKFYLFDSTELNGRDLLFIDQTSSFQDIDNNLNYVSYLKSKSTEYFEKILKLYECPLRLVRWCVISNFEKEKCRTMKNAFASRNIKPDLDCVSAKNALECMAMIRDHLADLITVDPADAFRASLYYGLRPLATEDYGAYSLDTEMPVQYAVAVVKKTDLVTNLWNLRSKRICATAFNDMAGWHVPVDYLIGIKELFVTNCHISKVAGEYFGRSCVPGAQDYSYNRLKTSPRSLCLACYSKGGDYCSRSHRELYYGDTGAFHCINEGRGDVAFVRHTSVKPNTDGRNTDQWARPLRQTDFELICKDGTRKSIEKYRECNLGKLPTRIVMTGGHRSEVQRNYLWNMLNFAQQLFGSDTNQDFTMFESMKEHPDLIFNDATVKLISIDREISEYLGKDLISMLYRTDDRLCNRANRQQLFSVLFLYSALYIIQQ